MAFSRANGDTLRRKECRRSAAKALLDPNPWGSRPRLLPVAAPRLNGSNPPGEHYGLSLRFVLHPIRMSPIPAVCPSA